MFSLTTVLMMFFVVACSSTTHHKLDYKPAALGPVMDEQALKRDFIHRAR